MKKLILILPFIFLFQKNIFSQNQFFPIKKASWEEAFIGIAGTPITNYLVLCGDTLVNDISYSKMYALFVDSSGVEVNRQYNGATRIELDLVFYLPVNASDDYLLYDFSLEAGQSITLETVFGDMNTLTVGSNQLINTLDGVTRRVIHFENAAGLTIETWIEGIGSDLGVLNRGLDLSSISDFSPYMNCYKFNGNLSWSNFNTQPLCEFTFDDLCETTSLNNLEKKNTTFQVLPNPFSENAVIDFQNINELEEPVLNVYDFQGRLIEKFLIGNEEKLNFFRKNLNAGVYVFELLDGKTTFATRKKIVIF